MFGTGSTDINSEMLEMLNGVAGGGKNLGHLGKQQYGVQEQSLDFAMSRFLHLDFNILRCNCIP